jgi:hypothetical protein
MKRTPLFLAIVLLLALLIGCGPTPRQQTSDEKTTQQQEMLNQESAAAIGLPAIKNFREKRILKDIMELCDQDGLVTYTYLENMNPVIVHGHTALGGKLTYFGETIGYGIPYATQFTNPLRVAKNSETQMQGNVTIPQADPNGLFKPAAAEGTWVLMKETNGKKVLPQYIEPRIVTLTMKLPMD